MKYISLLLFLFTFISIKAQEGSCGSPVTDVNKFADTTAWRTAMTAAGSTGFPLKQIPTVKDGNGTLVTFYYTVTSSANGTLGVIMSVVNDCPGTPSSYDNTTKMCIYSDGTSITQSQIDACGGTIRATRDCKLYLPADACSSTNNIPYDTKLKNTNLSSTFNPEWTKLTPNTTYTLVITMNLNSSCSVSNVSLSTYPPASSSCSASSGTVSVSGGTMVSATEYNLTTNGSTITISSTGSVLPSPSTVTAGSTSTYGYFIFTQAPTLPFTDVTPAGITSLPGFKGVVSGTSISDNNSSGSSSSVAGVTTLWFVPAVFDKKTGGLTLDDDADGCYAVGTPIKVNYSITPQPCGTCTTPNCPIGSVPMYNDRIPSSQPCTANGYTNCPGKGGTVCQNGVSIKGTTTTYQTVIADINGKLGVYVQGVTPNTLSFTIVSSLYETNDCNGTAKTPTKYSVDTKATGSATNVHGRSSGSGSWNPEWTGLTPGKSYILKTTFNMSGTDEITDYCMDYYGSTSCAAKIGTTAVTINGATPLVGKNPSANYYLLCKNDKIEINTTGYTLPPVGGGGTAGIGYMPFVCPPTAGKDPHTDACWGQKDLYDINNPSSDINDGSLVAQFPAGLNHTFYIVPITMDEAIANSMNYDQNNDGCFQTGTPIKITYLNDIAITKNEVCASSKVTFTISGGTPEYSAETGGKYTISTNKGNLSATTLSTSGGTVDLTGLSTNDAYTITVDDGTGCKKTFSGTYTCTCTAPTITGLTELCEGATLKLTGSGTEAAATPWVLQNTKATISGTGQTRTITGFTAGTCDITYKDNNGCSKTVTITINGNPTLTANPTSILVSATSAITVIGGSGTAATLNPWVSSSTANGTIVGAGQSATVTGVAAGNTNVIYTDSKGCDDTIQVTVTIPGCKTISNPSPAQILCQGSDPAPFTVSTSETAVNGIYFVVYPAIFKPANAAAIYSGIGTTGAAISNKLTASTGTATIDLPPLGSVGSFPVSIAGDYYVYAILDPVPSDVNCRPYAEIKVSIKDSIIPVVTSTAVASNATTFTWNDIPTANKFGIDTVRLFSIIPPSTWVPAGTIVNSTGGNGNTFTFNNIPLGQTAHIKITPQDISGTKLACSNSAMSSVTNKNCVKPIPLALSAPIAVCEGASLSIVGSLDPNSVAASFKWRISSDGANWSDVSGPDFDVTTLPTTISIPKTKFSMNNNFVKLVVTDKATGACKDSTLPVKLLVNESPNASISINPDPAMLCVGASQLISVTFLGNKGIAPYIFDYTLDGVVRQDSSLVGSSVLTYDFTTNDIIVDSSRFKMDPTLAGGTWSVQTAVVVGVNQLRAVYTIPEPSTYALFGLGALALVRAYRNRSRKVA